MNINIKSYALHHLQVFLSSLGRLSRNKVATTMTVTVIGIALALPAGLYVFLNNVQKVSSSWDDANQISVFLKPSLPESQGRLLAEQLKTWPDIDTTQFRSATQSLEEFRKRSGMSKLLNSLPRNPLPAIIIIKPKAESHERNVLQALVKRLQNMQEIDIAKLDMEWLQRLRSITNTAERSVSILAFMLSISVLLVVGNTIRLAILSRESEIRIIKLVGGTNAFVRRPFLYTGFWFGFLGGITAWFTLIIALSFINDPVQHLASLYNSQFSLSWLGGEMLFALPLSGIFLGVLGAWIAVSRHLDEIEPS